MDKTVSELNEATRNLLKEAVSKHETCMKEVGSAGDEQDVLRRLAEIEAETWSESAVEVDNRPMVYRHLVSLLDNLAVIEKRYADCEHDYLKAILAQRYWELLASVEAMAKLMDIAAHAHPGLRLLAVLRFQEALPNALSRISEQKIPRWFIRLLAQPSEMADFLSQASCRAVVEKAQRLLTQ